MTFIILAFFIVGFTYIFITDYIIPHYLLHLSEDKQLMKVNNDKTTRNALEILTKSKYLSVKKAIALCPKLDYYLFVLLFIEDDSNEILSIIAGREDVSPNILNTIYSVKKKDKDLVNIVSHNKTFIEYEKKLKQEEKEIREIIKNRV